MRMRVDVVEVGTGMDGDVGNVRCTEGVVYLDLIKEVCFVPLPRRDSLLDSFFEETGVIDISMVYQGLEVILWLMSCEYVRRY